MTSYFEDFVLMTGTAIVFFALSWSTARAIHAGKPLPPHIKRMLIYSFLLVLGTVYIMMVVSWLNWPPRMIVTPILAWATLLGYTAWRRHQRTEAAEPGLQQIPRKPITTAFMDSLPLVGLIVLLIASLVAWSVWAEGGAHLYAPVLCTAGAIVTICLVRRNRRVTIIIALRVVLVLGVIGAIGHPTGPLFVIIGIIGVALALLEKFWRDGPTPPGSHQTQTLFSGADRPPSTHDP